MFIELYSFFLKLSNHGDHISWNYLILSVAWKYIFNSLNLVFFFFFFFFLHVCLRVFILLFFSKIEYYSCCWHVSGRKLLCDYVSWRNSQIMWDLFFRFHFFLCFSFLFLHTANRHKSACNFLYYGFCFFLFIFIVICRKKFSISYISFSFFFFYIFFLESSLCCICLQLFLYNI